MSAAPVDLHLVRYFSSLVAVSGGRVVAASAPTIARCPLARRLYEGFDCPRGGGAALRRAVCRVIESKIRRYGFCTPRRVLRRATGSIPFGASEMLMHALRGGTIDAAVVVCDGAGTVICADPELVQGIGARMHTVLFTTPLAAVAQRIEAAGGRVVYPDASIDQAGGVEEALRLGSRAVAATVRGNDAGLLAGFAAMGKRYGASITSLVVCTTGTDARRIDAILAHADLVWGCASEAVRARIGPRARIQLSRAIPVFVLTRRGAALVAACSSDPDRIENLDGRRQYLIALGRRGRRVRIGRFEARINEARLPAAAREARQGRCGRSRAGGRGARSPACGIAANDPAP
jgi:putative methanogenesis marker protein 8